MNSPEGFLARSHGGTERNGAYHAATFSCADKDEVCHECWVSLTHGQGCNTFTTTKRHCFVDNAACFVRGGPAASGLADADTLWIVFLQGLFFFSPPQKNESW